MAKTKKHQEIDLKITTWQDLAAAIMKLTPEMRQQPVMFGDVRGDTERDAYSVNELGTVNDAGLFRLITSEFEDEFVEPGTLMLFT